MAFRIALARLETDDTFRAWRAEHPEHYLVHGFRMFDPAVKPEWQIGFYAPGEDRLVTFAVTDDGAVTMNPPSDAFKRDATIRELDVRRVAHDIDRALADAEAYRATHYAKHRPVRTITLVQHLERGQVWNVTFITDTFAVCNIKLDAATHAVVHASCETLLAWGDVQKGERRRD